MKLMMILLVLSMGACKKTDDVDSNGLVKHNDPLGFSIRHEPGWRVSFEKGAYIQMLSGDGKSRGVVFPFLSKEAMSAEACLKKAPDSFGDILPDAQLTSSKQTKQKPDEAIAEFSSQAGAALALCSMDDRSGIIFLAITPDGVKSKTMTSIITAFKSLSFDEPGKVVDAPSATTWIDPKEKSFHIDVPEGFTADGGLFRAGTVDVRIHVRLSSADKAINIGYGDKDIPTYSAQQNAVEGTTYNPGYGNVLIVKRFVSGGRFAREYATINAEVLGCPAVAAVGKELEDLTNALQQAENQTGGLIRRRVSAGEATVECMKDGQQHYGYIFAKTTLTPDNMGVDTGVWTAEVSGFTSPKSRVDEARKVAIAIYRSFQWEKAWSDAQGQVTMNTAQIVSSTGNQIADMMSRQYAKTQITMDKIFRNWSNATLGQTDVLDAATGESYKIAAGKNYYWRKSGTNVIAGTNQYERPDIDFTPLLEY